MPGLVLFLLQLASAWADCDPALKQANGGMCPSPTSARVGSGIAATADPAYDTQCGPPTDLGSGSGPYAGIPIRDQDGAGLCAGYAASNLVDAWRAQNHVGNPQHFTSPIEAATRWAHHFEVDQQEFWRYAFSPPPTGLQRPWAGVDVQGVFDEIRAGGSCDSRAVVEHVGARSFSDSMEYLLDTFRAANKRTGSDRRDAMGNLQTMNDSTARYRRNLERIAGNRAVTACDVRAQMVFDGVNTELVPTCAEVTRLLNDTPMNFVHGVVAHACTPEHVQPVPALPRLTVVQGATTPTAVNASLHTQLARPNSLGAVVSFCAAFLQGTHGRGFTGVTRPGGAATLSPDCGYHAAVVIGQRRNPDTGKCQFRLRNSWGASCALYSSEWSCDNGSVWVDSDVLSRNVAVVQHL